MIQISIRFEGFGTDFDDHSCLQDLRVIAGLFVLGVEVAEDRNEWGNGWGQACADSGGVSGGQTRVVVSKGEEGIWAWFDSLNDVTEGAAEVKSYFSEHADFIGKNLVKNMVKASFFDLMCTAFEPKSGWGILTGIRPVKIVHDLIDHGIEDPVQIRAYLKKHYRVSEDKIQLALRVAANERSVLGRDHDRLSVYLCIPFCASRCLYCSFPSNPLNQKGHLVPAYLEAMVREMRTIGDYLLKKGRAVDCVYIGGGTPTSLTESEFEMLLDAVGKYLVGPLSEDVGGIAEYTVEAGRPDTITLRKLQTMKQHGVTRVCVNPQTMSDATLRRIGRNHDSAAVQEVYGMARSIGFEVINTDLIVGLPGETTDDAQLTAERVISMRPENITVHTLAVKRASRLNEDRQAYAQGLEAATRVVDDMYDMSLRAFSEAGYEPYYLYRQKNMLGNLENVGLTLPGHKCLYNIRMMGDRHDIIAIGAGSVSKLTAPDGRVERLANAKGVEDYISRIEGQINQKIEWLTRL